MKNAILVYSVKDIYARDRLMKKLLDDETALIDMEDLLNSTESSCISSSYIIAIADALDMVDIVVWDDAKAVYNDPLAQAVIAIAEVLKKEISYRYDLD